MSAPDAFKFCCLQAAFPWIACLAILLVNGCERSGEDDPEAGADQVDATVLVKVAKKGPVSLRVTVSPKKPRLSDFVTLTLEIESALDVEVTPPSFGQSVGEFQIIDYKEGQPQ